MDTSTLFSETATIDDVYKALNARYSYPSCKVFNTDLSNVWGNFYKKKFEVLNPVLERSSIALKNTQELVLSAGYGYFA